MTKTTDAVEILRRRWEKNPRLKKLYEREKFNFQIATMIREMREARGLTQAELAKLIQTRQSVISRLEDADYYGHSLSMLQRIARALKKEVVVEIRDAAT